MDFSSREDAKSYIEDYEISKAWVNEKNSSQIMLGRERCSVYFNRVVRKLQFQNNYCLKKHFFGAFAPKNARLVRELVWAKPKRRVLEQVQ